MTTKPVYLVCVFNVYADEPDEPSETAEQRDRRKQTYHYVGFTANEANEMVDARFRRSSEHNWSVPLRLGEFPTKTDENGWELVDIETLTCPHCGRAF